MEWAETIWDAESCAERLEWGCTWIGLIWASLFCFLFSGDCCSRGCLGLKPISKVCQLWGKRSPIFSLFFLIVCVCVCTCEGGCMYVYVCVCMGCNTIDHWDQTNVKFILLKEVFPCVVENLLIIQALFSLNFSQPSLGWRWCQCWMSLLLFLFLYWKCLFKKLFLYV